GVESIDGLFAENERLCAFLSVAGETIDLALVAVAATLVGKVHVTFDDLTTNIRNRRQPARTYGDPAPCFAKGDECVRFEFCSTIVMIAAPGLMALDAQPSGTRVQLGERIGRLCAAAAFEITSGDARVKSEEVNAL